MGWGTGVGGTDAVGCLKAYQTEREKRMGRRERITHTEKIIYILLSQTETERAVDLGSGFRYDCMIE